MLAWEARVRKGLGEALAHDPGGLTEPHPLELLRDRKRLGLEQTVQRVLDRLPDQLA